ncbi:MAG: TIGR03915 family putative DNA repair protein [Oscillospiraceae bacterium]|nr:TIGR03915 family putative DNA repair protein [Oscillospiraceae bacterium]
MRQRTDVIFVYDGTFDGFMCCVHEYYYSSFNPVEIICEEDIHASLFQLVTINTDPYKAAKVKSAISEKISSYSLRFLQECILCYGKEKEIHMLGYIVKGFRKGAQIHRMVEDDDISWLLKAHNHLKREKHLYLGIVRFYKANDAYISVITPKNHILPLIGYHFTQRFSNQNFMIYDATNKEALLYYEKQTSIIKADNIILPEMDDEELAMQKLWKLFYDTIAIKERYNPKCRMSFLPKRTWDLLPEMKDL